MSSEGSVTHWIGELRAGNRAAAQELWNRYYRRMIGLARKRLQGLPTRKADEEDVALSAFRTFFRRAEAGLFPTLEDSEDLWRLLMCITARKALNLQRDERREKRGGGRVRGLPSEDELAEIVGTEPSPEFAAQVAEEFRRLIQMLPDVELQQIAMLKMEGLTTAEIGDRLQAGQRRVQRRLKLIFALWEEDAAA